MKEIWIPEKLRPCVESDTLIVNVHLRDGRIVRDVAYNRDGRLVGTAVGG
jgi:hypothetical protein